MILNRLLTSAAACLLIGAAIPAAANNTVVTSPDGHIRVDIEGSKQALNYTVSYDGQQILANSPVGLTLTDGTTIGPNANFSKPKTEKEHIDAPLYRFKEFDVTYNEVTGKLPNGWSITFRVFDDGVAYRFNYAGKKPVVVKDETAAYNFAGDPEAWLAYTTNNDDQLAMAFQNYYDHTPLSKAQDKLVFLPATVDLGNVKATVLESDLEAYPGMFVKAGPGGLKGVFAQRPNKFEQSKWRQQRHVRGREDYIAKVEGNRTFPWRILAITDQDTKMPVNNLVYALASPNRIGDTSWIKPGKVAWDWWNAWNVKGVDFESGINMPTYKYYIDFAAKNGLEYIILDEGWYDPGKGDMLTVIPELNLEELVAYGKSKGVDIILWTVFNVLDDQLEEACKKYSDMGIKGFKVDFLDRDDQEAVEMAYRIAEGAARHNLTLDYHGFYKPTGFNRTYPNIINVEAVFGMEEVKWADPKTDFPLYDVTMPYIRMMAGPLDYTPGAMRNGTPKTWKAIYTQPISMGTRAHQAASYIVHDSPLTMLADTPTSYEAEPEYTSFLASVPVVTNSTQIQNGKLGEYIVTVREYPDGLYGVGGLTNWDARDVKVDFSFLPAGKTYKATIVTDGINASKNAEDFKLSEKSVTSADQLDIHMAPGGGFAIMLAPAN